MPEFHPPQETREVHQVPHPLHRVYVVRCSPVDADPLADWCDSVLGRDYFFKRRHLASILERRNNGVWCIVVDDVCSGLVILYDGSILHNLYVAPDHRKSGIGSAVLQLFRPRRIRSKTNMLAGDPTEFYLRNGYVVDQPDPNRPHILDMVLPQGASGEPERHGAAKPSTNGHHSDLGRAESPAESCEPRGHVVPADFLAPLANARAVGVGHTSAAPVASASPVATPTPGDSPALADPNHVVLTLEQYNVLATLKKNRDRIAAYRAKRKAEKVSPAN